MEEDQQSPPGDEVQTVDEVGYTSVLLAVALAIGVHPILHFLQRVTGLVVAPITIDQSTETNGYSTEILLKTRVVASRRRVLVDDDFRPVHVEPDIGFPCFIRIIDANESPHLLFEAQSIRANPVRQADHSRLIDNIVVERWPDIDTHRPDLGILRISILVYLRVRITVRCPPASRPVHSSHVEIDVIRHRDFWMVFGDVVFGPIIRAALASLLTGPEAENHRSATFEVCQYTRGLEHHRCSSGIVVGADAGAVTSRAGGVRVENDRVGGRGDIEMSAEDQPFID